MSPRKAKKKRMSTSNRVLLLLGLGLSVFVAVMIVTFWVKGAVPDTLIQYVLGAGGLETVALAGIKIGKLLSGKESEEM